MNDSNSEENGSKSGICCFIGHRKIDYTKTPGNVIYETAVRLIVEKNAMLFLFGSKSLFDDLCYKVISTLKEIYP